MLLIFAGTIPSSFLFCLRLLHPFFCLTNSRIPSILIWAIQHNLKTSTWDVKEAESVNEAKALAGKNYTGEIKYGDVISVEASERPDWWETNWYKVGVMKKSGNRASVLGIYEVKGGSVVFWPHFLVHSINYFAFGHTTPLIFYADEKAHFFMFQLSAVRVAARWFFSSP